MSTAASLTRDLAAIVGERFVREPLAAELEDATRWTGLRGRADLTVEPRDAEQTRAVVRHAYEHDIPITTRGGGTGLAGGAVPDGGIVLSMRRLNRIRSIDPQWWRCETEAGVTTADLQRRARESGLRFPPDPGAAESSQIGGNLATNAGGPLAFGHGSMRAWVLGVEAVLAPGELVRLGGAMRKDVAGYDIRSLLIGSEGTLGVITAAWLRLVPPPAARQTVMALFPGTAAAQDAIGQTLTCGAEPVSLELFDGGSLRHAASTLPVPGLMDSWLQLGAPEQAVLMTAGLEGDLAEATAARSDALLTAWEMAGAAWHAALSQAQADTASGAESPLGAWRAGVSGAVAASLGGKLSEDVAVPTDRVGELLDATAAIAAAYGLEHATWGHAGDGNLHCSFLLDPADPQQRRRAHDAAEELFAVAIGLGGTISGEHGLGRLKSRHLQEQWAPAAVAAHRAIKHALDPKGLFNPGRKLA